MAMFKKGYGAVKEEKERQDKAREAAGSKLWNFFLRDDGDEAPIRFLTEEPVTFDAHIIKNGKQFETIVCPGEGCEHCDDGEKTSFRGAYLIIDKRKVEITDKKTNKKKKVNAQLRLYIQGARVLSQLDRYSSKYGLTNRDYTIARTGSGQDTTYAFDPEEKSKVTKEEIKNLLPEKLRDEYDGSMDSLYAIVEDQLALMLAEAPDEDDDDDNEVDEREEKSRRRALVDVDDDDTEDEDDDDDASDDEEDDDPTPPRKPTGGAKKPGLKSSFKSKK